MRTHRPRPDQHRTGPWAVIIGPDSTGARGYRASAGHYGKPVHDHSRRVFFSGALRVSRHGLDPGARTALPWGRFQVDTPGRRELPPTESATLRRWCGLAIALNTTLAVRERLFPVGPRSPRAWRGTYWASATMPLATSSARPVTAPTRAPTSRTASWRSSPGQRALRSATSCGHTCAPHPGFVRDDFQEIIRNNPSPNGYGRARVGHFPRAPSGGTQRGFGAGIPDSFLQGHHRLTILWKGERSALGLLGSGWPRSRRGSMLLRDRLHRWLAGRA